MRDYEATFILVPTLDDKGVRTQLDEVKTTIGSLGGEVTVDKEWGRRRLAYPIDDHSEGVYHVLRFMLEGAKLAELERYFRFNDNVLRALVIRNENTPLENLGQTSESEEHGSFRDDARSYERRDREHSGRPLRYSARGRRDAGGSDARGAEGEESDE
jgi:small subunit ribosomal protein S6